MSNMSREDFEKKRDEKIQQIAKVCHQANKAYCETIGDTSQPDWDSAPDWQKKSAINGVVFHLQNGGYIGHGMSSESHDNWMKEKLLEGWRYGEKKDTEAKTHPCLLPYKYLSNEQKMKDYIFSSIVHAFRVQVEIQEKERAHAAYQDQMMVRGSGEKSAEPVTGSALAMN